jgi:hypothetical protein
MGLISHNAAVTGRRKNTDIIYVHTGPLERDARAAGLKVVLEQEYFLKP